MKGDALTVERIERILAYRQFIREGEGWREITRRFGISRSAYRDDRALLSELGEEELRRRQMRLRGGLPEAPPPLPTSCQYQVPRHGTTEKCGAPGYPYCPFHRAKTMPLGNSRTGAGTGASLMTGYKRKGG